MSENKAADMVQTQLKLLLAITGDEVPDDLIVDKFGEDSNIAKIKYEWKEFYDDIMDGGAPGFGKHYDVSEVDMPKGAPKDSKGAFKVNPLNEISMAVLEGMQSLQKEMKINKDVEAATKTKKPYEHIELTPETCREIEFNIGEEEV